MTNHSKAWKYHNVNLWVTEKPKRKISVSEIEPYIEPDIPKPSKPIEKPKEKVPKALRIDGVTPAAINILMIYCKKNKYSRQHNY